MTKYKSISKVAVLGAGVMGSRIACHFANIGVEVLLLDLGPEKNVREALNAVIKSTPSPLYDNAFSARITVGTFDANMPQIAQVDWIIEVVIEQLGIKQKLFEHVEQFRKPGTIISSNTSGIPIHELIEGRSEDFQLHFCGTHFFNPPRYLRLLEIIPTPKTKPELLTFLTNYGEKYLGKTTIVCKDTPAFIANRIGVFGIMHLFHIIENMKMPIEWVESLTGPMIGRPKSATFRTCDVVGIDTLAHVALGVANSCPTDEQLAVFQLPAFLTKMLENKWLGAKTNIGFFRKEKDKSLSVLDLNTLEYKPMQKHKSKVIEEAKKIESQQARLKYLLQAEGKEGDFYREMFLGLFAYVSHRIPEITSELFKIDAAMTTGFGWDMGPFEIWDAVGLAEGKALLNKAGKTVAPWVEEMLSDGITAFYKIENGIPLYYSSQNKKYLPISETQQHIALKNLSKESIVWKNTGATLKDIGDGIVNLEFHSKMNTIGGDVIQGINTAIEKAEKEFAGLVISNEGANFSAGANVGMIFMMAADQEWDELNLAIKIFQNTMMRVRYSSIPVVVAPHNLSLGGACELSMHADKVVAHAETYMGLVEFGVGLIPGGGGTKEFAVRLSEELREGDIELNNFRQRFLTIGQAKVSTSAEEAFQLGYLRKGQDAIIVSRTRHVDEAKLHALALAEKGYTQPTPKKQIRVLGKTGLGLAYLGADSMKSGGYISEHDVKISQKLAYVLCGGDLSTPSLVTEQYLLDLERETFLSLCGERKTLERMQSILTKGKILRN